MRQPEGYEAGEAVAAVSGAAEPLEVLSSPPVAPTAVTILIVDDDPVVRGLM